MLEIIKNYNCIYKSHVEPYFLPKCCEEKEPVDEQLYIALNTITNNICDVDPLDKTSNTVQPSKNCLT